MKLQIAGVVIELQGVAPELLPDNTRQFESSSTLEPDLFYQFHLQDQLPAPDDSWRLLYQKESISVYGKADLELRLLFEPNYHTLYGVYVERDDSHIDVYYARVNTEELKIDTIFISCLSLERHFARRSCYILHCAFLAYKNQAILFSGPSGIGKSTHADLWCKHIPDTHVVNGDRCLITPNPDGTFEANGWPVCGSSQICHIEHYPIHAIVFMGQSPTNQVRELGLMQRFQLLNMQLMVNHWNPAATRQAMDWMLHFAQRVTIKEYHCNLESEAPFILGRSLGFDL